MAISKNPPTQERLKELLSYDAETGLFRWNKRQITNRWGPVSNVQFAGKIAGGFCSKGYVQIRIDGHAYAGQRLAWLYEVGEWPSLEIDHINGVKDDNRFTNLRLATRSQNASNRPITSRNSSGHKGVSWDGKNKKWRASIRANRKGIFLGRFDRIEDAAVAYTVAAKKFHQEFARVA